LLIFNVSVYVFKIFYKTLVPNLLHGACQSFILLIFNYFVFRQSVKKCKVLYNVFTVALQILQPLVLKGAKSLSINHRDSYPDFKPSII